MQKSHAQLKKKQRELNKSKGLIRFERYVTQEEKKLLVETLNNHRSKSCIS